MTDRFQKKIFSVKLADKERSTPASMEGHTSSDAKHQMKILRSLSQ